MYSLEEFKKLSSKKKENQVYGPSKDDVLYQKYLESKPQKAWRDEAIERLAPKALTPPTQAGPTYLEKLTENREKAKQLSARVPETATAAGNIREMIFGKPIEAGTVNPRISAADFSTRYDGMTDREKAVYSHLKNTNAKDADEYLKAIDMDINQRNAEKRVADARKIAEENTAAGLYARFMGNNVVSNGAASAYELWQGLRNQPVDPNHPLLAGQDIVKGQNEAFVGDSTGIERYLREGAMGAFDFGTNLMTAGAIGLRGQALQNMVKGSFAAQAFAGSARDAAEREGTGMQSALTGTASAVLATVIEGIGLDRLAEIGKLANARGVLKSMARSILPEAAEEAVEEAGNILADAVIMGDKNEIVNLYNTARANGATQNDAMMGALGTAGKRIGESAIIGGISGGMIGGGVAMTNRALGGNVLENDVPDTNVGETEQLNRTTEQPNRPTPQNPATVHETAISEELNNSPAETRTQPTEAQTKPNGVESKIRTRENGYIDEYYHENGARVMKAEAEKRGNVRDAEDIYRPYYTAGVMGLDFSEVEVTATAKLADQLVAQEMYRAGIADRQADMTARLQGQGKIPRQTPGVLLRTEAVTEKQRALANLVAKVGKMEVVLVDELPKRDNGRYKDGRIYVSLKAESFSGALFHEAVHYIAQANVKGYDRMAQTVMRMAAEIEGVSVDKYVRRYEKAYTEDIADGNYNALAIREELVADAFQMLAADEARLNSLIAELKQSEPTVLNQIKEFLDSLLETLKGLVKDGRFHAFAEDINKDIENTKKLQKIFAEELKTAGDNVWKTASATNGTADALTTDDLQAANDILPPEGENVRMSRRLWEESAPKQEIKVKPSGEVAAKMSEAKSGKEVLINAYKENGFSKKEIDKKISFIDGVAEFLDKAALDLHFVNLADINDAKLVISPRDGSIVLSAMVKNGEYAVNFDLTKICAKRVAMSNFIDTLAKRKGRSGADTMLEEISLTSSNIYKMNEILRDAGYETACLGCFVESRRYNIETWATEFLDIWNGMVDKYGGSEFFGFSKQDVFVNDLTHDQVEKLNDELETYGKTKDNKKLTDKTKKIEDLIKNVPVMRKKLKMVDLITADGRTNLHKKYPELESLLLQHYGSNTPKSVEVFTPYNNEIALMSDKVGEQSLAEYLHSIAGVRSQSFSDFIITHVFDVLQKTADMEAKRLPGHVYTKVPARVRLFGMTGEKHNMSIMFNIDPDVSWEYAGLREDGSYFVGDEATSKKEVEAGRERTFVQSFPWGEAVAIQNDPRYSANCGIIGVSYSYNANMKMLDDPEIPYIIGYHASGMPTEIKAATHISLAADYTPVQNTLEFKGFKKVTSKSETVPPYATWATGKKKATGKGVEDAFDIKESYEKNGAKETLRKLFALAEDKGYALDTATAKIGSKKQNGHGDFDIYGDLAKTKNPKKTADNYIDWCMEKGFLPAFYEFALHENYYKFLFDFRVYDGVTGKYAPQKAVTTTFPENFLELLDGYLKAEEAYNAKQAEKFEPTLDEIYESLKADGGRRSATEDYYDDYDGETFETEALAELNDVIREFNGITEGSVPHLGDVERISREFLHKIKSKYPVEEFAKKFSDILSHVMRARNSGDIDTAINALTILSKEAMGQSEKLNTEVRDKYRDVVTLLKETPLEITPAMKEELKDYGGFVKFRNQYFNRMKLNNSGEDVGEIYNKIVEMHPDLIASVELQEGEELSKVDMLVALAEIVDNTKPYLENPYEMDMETYAKNAAYELIGKISEVGTQAGKMLELHAEYKEKMSKMREELRADRREQALNRRRSANRRAIERDVVALRKWISKPTNQKHIPERFRQNLAAILVKIVGSSKEMKLSAADLTRFGAEYARLNPEYSGNDKGSIHLQDYDAEIELMISKLKKAAERSGGTLKLSDMNREQMEWLRKTIKGLRKALENANELVSAESNRKASEEAEAFIEMADTMRKAPRGKVLRSLLDMFSLSMLTPEMFMKGLGDRMYNILWKGYSKGHAKKATMTQQAMDFMNDLIKPSEVSGWQKAALKEVTLTRTGENGETISHTLYMSIPQIMYLHCAVKRNQAKKHLFGDDKTAGSGMKIEPEEKIRLRGRKTAKKALEQTEVLKLTEDEVREVTALLTDRQKEVADKMQKFLTEVVSEWGNETSMLMYGYRKFTESNYIPIIVDSEYTNKMYGKENTDAKTLQNMGAAKEVSEWAGQPIVITDIFSLFNRHVDQMSSYNAFVPILSDTNKFMNYMKMPKNQNDLVTKEEADAIRATMTEEEIQAWEDIRKANEEDNEMPAVEEKEKTGPVAFVNKTELKSVKNAMSHILGPKAEAYMHKLMVDINGAAKKDDVGVVPQMALRNMKIASVGANLRVIVQQPMSMFRAMAEMNPVDVLFAPFALPNDWEKMRKYAPITLWKDWGGAEMDTGRTLEEMIAGQSLFNKITGLSMAPAGAFDKLTWGRLWKGCEMEVKRKHPDWVGERLDEAVGERFTQVIDRTQVVDSVLHRSENMRSKSFFVKMTTSFMSEPIKGYNLVYDAVRGVYRNPKDKDAHKRLMRVLTTHFINALMVSLAAGLVDAMRDDEDDDDEFWDTWLAASVGDYSKAVTLKDKAAAFWASNLNDNLNPMNMLPYVKDVYSVIQGYDVVRTDFSWATDIVRWVQKTKKMNEGGSEYSVKGYILYTAAQFSKVTGMPAKSLERDLYGLADTLIQHAFGDAEGRYNLRTFKYAPGKEDNASMYAEMIVMARFNGDTVLANRIKGDMLNGGLDEEKLDTKLENAYSNKVEIAYIEGDTAKLAEIRNRIQKDGYKEKVYNKGVRDGAKELFEAALAVKDEDEARRLMKVVEEHNGGTDSMMEDFNDTFNN